ncbi:MAG: rod shape-determining protein RodA [Actinomycetes bacterium]
MFAPSAGSTSSYGGRFRATDLAAPWRHVDVLLIGAVAGVLLIGSVMVESATKHLENGGVFVAKHLLFIVLGIGVMAALSLIDYRRILAVWPVLYGASLALLAGVLSPLGATVNGTKGWYRLGPIQLQPAEFAKVAMIVAIAAYLGTGERVDLRRLVGALMLMAGPIGLTMLQPDLGSSLVFIVAGVGMMVVGGVRMRHLAVLVVLGAIAVVGILNSGTLDQYQKDRLTSFVTPDGQSYNVRQAQIAISSGGITGYGLGKGPQTKGGYVPEQQTDFIFTVAGEELGFLGSGVLIALLGLMLWRIWRIAQIAPDPAGTLLCVGVMSMFLFHGFENIGMTLGIMPVTGIPLPFVSYGGSAMLVAFAALGLVQSVHMHRFV